MGGNEGKEGRRRGEEGRGERDGAHTLCIEFLSLKKLPNICPMK